MAGQEVLRMQNWSARIPFEEKTTWNYDGDLCLRLQRLTDTPRKDPSDVVIFLSSVFIYPFEFQQFPPFVSFTQVVFFLLTIFLTARSLQRWVQYRTLLLPLSSVCVLTWFVLGVVGWIFNSYFDRLCSPTVVNFGERLLLLK